MKKLFILGSTRGLGKEILKLAINEDFEIRCLVRDPQKVQRNKNLKIFKGDATNINDLRNSLGDSEYIISSLNVMRKNIFPWSKITNSKNTVSDSIKNIIKISNERKIYRIISVSAIGVGESINEIPYWFKLLINKSNIKFPYIDLSAILAWKKGNFEYRIQLSSKSLIIRYIKNIDIVKIKKNKK